jgi:F1F0 ATPase subunit 2
MSDYTSITGALVLGAAFVAGAALGGAYFLGLWYTVRRQTTASLPALWLLVSGVGRLVLLLVGFYLVMAGSWERLLACLAGFVVARLVLTRKLGAGGADRSGSIAGKDVAR